MGDTTLCGWTQIANTCHCPSILSLDGREGEACNAAVEAYTASLPPPPTSMCELVLILRHPKSSWRTLGALHAPHVRVHRKMNANGKERAIDPTKHGQQSMYLTHEATGHEILVALGNTVATGSSNSTWPTTPANGLESPARCKGAGCSGHWGEAYRVAAGNGTQLNISLANFDRLARSPAGL